MTDIIMHGCNGRMGQVIVSLVAEDPDVRIVAGVDISGEKKNDFPVYTKLSDVKEKGVIIDFSNASAADGLMDYVEETRTPVVLCSTGLSEAQIKRLDRVSTVAPVLRSANMSLGVNTVMKLIKTAAEILAPKGFDIEIVEKHHNQKLDAPSGTALALADVMNEALDKKYDYVYDRSKRREKRPENEIGISAVRGGTIVGEHDIIFAGTDEVIEIRHEAFSRKIFAKGAIAAAKFLDGKAPGMYGMPDVIG
ncbi:MAG: 4-hydroxy-tetrahydrodipicolinate reductase [Catonella sp.]|nr:4-hydroxy-tetrahydrodipicolinate reductase [Catonella sp.]MDY6356277.1 4-hydroxy-tetrahydrodipicolinate reductase [Catonella sp.]